MSDSRRTVNDFLFINLLPSFLSFFPKNVFCSGLLSNSYFSITPFSSSGFFCSLHSGVHTPRSFSFPSSPFFHFFSSSSSFRGHSHKSFRNCPLTNPLGSVLSRILWKMSSHESFGKSPFTNPLGNLSTQILWEISSHGSFRKRPLTNPLKNGRFFIHSITTPSTEWFSLFL